MIFQSALSFASDLYISNRLMVTIYRFTSTACLFVRCCLQKHKQYKIRFLWNLCGIVPKAHAFCDLKWDSRSTAQRQTQSPAHFPLCSERWPHPFPSCLWSLVWPLNTQMPRGFLSGNNYGHHCLFTPFLTSWSRTQCVIVFPRTTWHTLWWSRSLSPLVAGVPRGLPFVCGEKVREVTYLSPVKLLGIEIRDELLRRTSV